MSNASLISTCRELKFDLPVTLFQFLIRPVLLRQSPYCIIREKLFRSLQTVARWLTNGLDYRTQLFVFPGSTFLFQACYGLTLGSLGSCVLFLTLTAVAQNLLLSVRSPFPPVPSQLGATRSFSTLLTRSSRSLFTSFLPSCSPSFGMLLYISHLNSSPERS